MLGTYRYVPKFIIRDKNPGTAEDIVLRLRDIVIPLTDGFALLDTSDDTKKSVLTVIKST